MKNKGQNRCQLSGKIIGNKPAVLVEHAEDYLRKLGHLVSRIKFLWIFIFLITLLPIIYAVQHTALTTDNHNLPNSNICLWNNASIVNSFLEFDGVNDQVTNESVPDFYTSALTEISYCIWAKPNYPQNPSTHMFRETGDQIGIAMDTANGVKCSILEEDNDYVNSGTPYAYLNNYTWNHVCCVYNSNDQIFTMYINGQNFSSSGVSVDNMTKIRTGSLAVGYEGASDRFYNGALDEFRIYDDSLTELEVLEIYNSGLIQNNSLPNGNLILWWPMNEGTGTTVYDQSGNNNHGI